MNKVILQMKKIIRSQTINQMLNNTPWTYIYTIIFIPMFFFMALPVYQLISCIINPISQVSSYGVNVQAINTTAGIIGAFMLLISFAKIKNQRTDLKKLLCSFIPLVFFLFMVIMMIVSTLVNGFTDLSKHGDFYRQESLFTFIEYFLIYFLCASLIRSIKLKYILLYTFVIVSIPIGICAIIHSCIIPLKAFENGSGLSTIFHQFNHYGYFLLLSILISSGLLIKSKSRLSKLLCLVSFVLNNVVLIFNDTFGCYLACFVGLVFGCVVFSIIEKKLNKASIVMIILFIVISLIMTIWYDTVFTNIATFLKDINKVADNPDDSAGAGTGRWTLWIHTFKYIKEKPVFGFGVEGIRDRLDTETAGINNRPHNEFLQYAAFFGIPAMISYIAGILSVYINGLKMRYKLDVPTTVSLIAAFGYIVSSVFGNTMYYTAPYFFILLGLGFSVKNTISDDSKN